jgi:hypothetical protein
MQSLQYLTVRRMHISDYLKQRNKLKRLKIKNPSSAYLKGFCAFISLVYLLTSIRINSTALQLVAITTV